MLGSAACLLSGLDTSTSCLKLAPSPCSQRVNSVQRLRHSLLRADRLLEKHEDDVSLCGEAGSKLLNTHFSCAAHGRRRGMRALIELPRWLCSCRTALCRQRSRPCMAAGAHQRRGRH